MNRITITFPDNTSIEAQNEIRAILFLDRFENKEKIIACKVNNEIYSLDMPIMISSRVEPIYIDTREGANIYRRSLCFVLAACAHKLFPDKRLLVGHSLAYGYYYTFDNYDISEDELELLKKEMEKLISQDKVIDSKYISYKEACKLFESLHMTETRKQLNFRCPSKILVNTMDEFSDLYFEPLVYSTKILKVFDLMKYQQGFLLRFPKHQEPHKLPEFIDQPKLYTIYSHYKEWGKRLNVTSAASLNEMIHNRQINEYINVTETLQMCCISEIATQIFNRKTVKLVLIAGPSSSGKTTTSKKLALQLEARGFKPKVISLDNYYIGRELTPKDEFGNYDYECLEALNIPLLNENLIDLFNGKEVKIPSYNFNEGKSYYKAGNTMHLDESDILVMEGIHGLNDKLTPLVPNELKFKIYLSALTQLNLDDHNRISTSDNRLIRRIVRDSQFRGKSAADTIGMWENVQKGERLHIFPFQNNADAMLNTALDYELPVLKVYADPLLRCVNPSQKEYSEASRLLTFLNYFSSIPATAVPDQSIIREFIGGSAFKY